MYDRTKKLTDIIGAGQQDDLAAAWNNTTAAGEFSPLPNGDYNCRVLAGELFASKGKSSEGKRPPASSKPACLARESFRWFYFLRKLYQHSY